MPIRAVGRFYGHTRRFYVTPPTILTLIQWRPGSGPLRKGLLPTFVRTSLSAPSIIFTSAPGVSVSVYDQESTVSCHTNPISMASGIHPNLFSRRSEATRPYGVRA
ncbi:hypothetical protein H4219_003247 [Mycoemilia scoparia]|uniref:Uncharacterized protein n=1 Tax=Mycoemilia scoparia TaxID=417184 RepID=A0A9W7ZW54_9FUNG|nr:hypothetical protein H4219_003247 [Mycoemilia scoparia]